MSNSKMTIVRATRVGAPCPAGETGRHDVALRSQPEEGEVNLGY